MKKLWLFGAALAMSFSICTSVQAQTPTEQVSPEMKAKIQKMLEVSGAAAVQRLMPEQVTKMMLAQLEKSGKTLPEATQQKIEELMNQSFTELFDLMIPLYARHYTSKDVDQMIAFYESPVGRKMAASAPEITIESMGMAQQWGQTFAQRLATILQEGAVPATSGQ